MAESNKDFIDTGVARGLIDKKNAEAIRDLHKETTEQYKAQLDLANRLVDTFKNMMGYNKGISASLADQASFSKQILSDGMARRLMNEQINSEIEDAEKKILELRQMEIDSNHKNFEIQKMIAEKVMAEKDVEEKKLKLQAAQLDIKNKNEELAAAMGRLEKQDLATRAQRDQISKEREDAIEKNNLIKAAAANILLDSFEKQLQVSKNIIDNTAKEINLTNSIISDAQEELRLSEETLKNKKAQVSSYEDINNNILDTIKKQEEELAKRIHISKQLKLQSGYMAHLKDTGHDVTKIFGQFGANVMQFVKNLKTVPPHFLLMDILIAAGLKRFKELDSAAERFRKETGFTNTQMVKLRREVENVNRKYQEFGVSIEKAYDAAKALTDIFGRTTLLAEDLVGKVALLAVNLGVAEKDSASVLATFQGLGKASPKIAMDMITATAAMSENAGVPFKMVMEDISNASSEVLSVIGAIPGKLVKATISARAMGTTLAAITSSSRKLLDYSSSINDELEASALLGRSISFQKARQLAYEENADEAAKATLETVKRAGNFNSMNIYQREALAKASGMELKDLTKMLAVEAQREEILRGNDPVKKKQLEDQDAELAKMKEIADLQNKDVIAQGQKLITQQKMQGLMTQMQNMLEAIAVELGSALEPIFRIVATLLVPALKIVGGLVRGLLSPITKFVDKLSGGSETGDKFAAAMAKAAPIIDKMVVGAEYLGEAITIVGAALFKIFAIGSMFNIQWIKIGLQTEKVVGWFARAAAWGNKLGVGLTGIMRVVQPFAKIFGSVFSVLMKSLGFVAKFAGPIGLIVNIVQVVVEYAKELIDIWSSDDMSVGDKIIASLIAIPKAIWNTLIQPFVDGIDWLLKWAFPNIPFGLGDILSEMGKMFKDAITTIAKSLFDPILDAFKDLYDVFTGKYSIGEGILRGLEAVSTLVLFWIVAPFKAALKWIFEKFMGHSPSEIGEGIVNGIKAVGSFVLDALTLPFSTALDFISSIFGGDGQLGTTIIKGIKKVASFIFDIIVSPFKQAFDAVGGFIGKLFGGRDVGKQAAPVQEASPVSSVIEVNHLDELRDVVQELVDAVATMNTSKPSEVVSGTKLDTSALEAKLDKLTDLLVGGAVRVYLDGKDVSAAMTGIGR